MATSLATLVIDVKANTRGLRKFQREVDRNNKSVRGLRKSTISLRSAMIALASAAAMGFAIKKVFELGAAAEETASKFRTVFGPAATSVQEFIDDFATMAGLSTEAAREITATTGAIVQGMGFAQEASAKFAEEVVRVAGDLSSFNNIPVADTARAIQSALTGEREQVKRYGIVIREAAVQRRAFALTGKTIVKQLTEEDRALATLALITEQAGVAMGDLARTQDSAANRARKLGAEFRNLRDTAASLLLPAFNTLLGAVSNSELSFANLEKALKENAATFVGWAAVASSSAKTAFVGMEVAAFSFVNVVISVLDLIQLNWTGTLDDMKARWDLMLADFSRGFSALGTEADRLAQVWRDAVEDFRSGADDAAAGLAGLKFGLTAAGEAVGPLDRALVGFTTDFTTRIGSATAAGKESFDGFFESVIAGFARLAAEMAIFNALSSAFPGSNFVSALGASLGLASGTSSGITPKPSGRAQGGPVSSGKAYVVGEKGPELFVPGRSGGITPTPARAAPAPASERPVVFNQNVIFNFSAIDGASVGAMLEQQKGAIINMVSEAAQASAGVRRVFQGG